VSVASWSRSPEFSGIRLLSAAMCNFKVPGRESFLGESVLEMVRRCAKTTPNPARSICPGFSQIDIPGMAWENENSQQNA